MRGLWRRLLVRGGPTGGFEALPMGLRLVRGSSRGPAADLSPWVSGGFKVTMSWSVAVAVGLWLWVHGWIQGGRGSVVVAMGL